MRASSVGVSAGIHRGGAADTSTAACTNPRAASSSAISPPIECPITIGLPMRRTAAAASSTNARTGCRPMSSSGGLGT